jgi:hypothetical protein
MGKKGPIGQSMGYMHQLAPEGKPKLGAIINEVKANLDKLMVEANVNS